MASSAKRRAVGLAENPEESENSSEENDSGEEDSEASEEEINEVNEQNDSLHVNATHGLVSCRLTVTRSHITIIYCGCRPGLKRLPLPI